MYETRSGRSRGGAALLAALVWFATAIGAPREGGEPERPREVTLSQSAPQAVFPLDEQRVKKSETTIAVRVVRADNPDRAEFTVAVMLVQCRGRTEAHPVPVGSLGVYPTGESGGMYALDLGPALQQMRAAGYLVPQSCVRLELRPLRASADWKRLRVTVTSPEWKKPPRDR